jgi:hypothetical protein
MPIGCAFERRRTIQLSQAHQPALDLPARSQDANLFYGIPAIQSYPFDGSAWVIWDDGPGLVSPPPLTNTAPDYGARPARRRARDGGGADPEVGLPGREWQRGGRLWRPAVPHRRLYAVGAF